MKKGLNGPRDEDDFMDQLKDRFTVENIERATVGKNGLGTYPVEMRRRAGCRLDSSIRVIWAPASDQEKDLYLVKFLKKG